MTPPDDFGPAAREEGAYRRGPDRSIGVLFADLADDLRRLFRLELALFQRELGEKAGRLGRGAAALAAGGIVLFSGWLALLAAAILALSLVLHPWLAALIVGSGVLLIGVILLWLGKRWLDTHRLVPQRSLNAVREDGAWIKERIS